MGCTNNKNAESPKVPEDSIYNKNIVNGPAVPSNNQVSPEPAKPPPKMNTAATAAPVPKHSNQYVADSMGPTSNTTGPHPSGRSSAAIQHADTQGNQQDNSNLYVAPQAPSSRNEPPTMRVKQNP